MFSHSLTIVAFSFPSFVRRGEGEVEGLSDKGITLTFILSHQGRGNSLPSLAPCGRGLG